MSLDRTWERIQRKTFTGWVNNHLKKRGSKVEDIEKDLCDGLNLIKLIEVLSGEDVPYRYEKKPNMRLKQVANVGVALRWVQEKGIKLTAIGPEDIVDGNLKLILGLIWTIILRFQIEDISMEELSAKEGLLRWCQKKTEGYKDVKVENFHMSFQDGLALCALIHKHRPDLLDYSKLSKENKAENLQLAFDVAAKHLDVPQLLDVADIVDVPKPDERSMLTYVSYYYHVFSKSMEAENAGARIGKIIDFTQANDAAKNDYLNRARKLKEWIGTTSQSMNEPEFDGTWDGVQAKLGEFKDYKSNQKKPHLAGHGMKGFLRPPASLNEDLWRWTSPELLLSPARVLSHSELMAHDVYSFGMLMYELVFHRVPYDSVATDVRTWSDRGSFDCSLCLSAILYSKHRPLMADSPSDVPSEYFQLMEQCWHADPKQRPVFPDIYTRLLSILKGEREAAMVYSPPDPAPQVEPITPVSNLIHVLNPHGAVLAIGTPHSGWGETPEEIEKENYLWVGTDKGKVVIVDEKNGEIVKTLSVMWKNKGEKDTDDFRTYWVAPSPTCCHHMWCVDEDGSLTCFDVRTYAIVGRAVGSGAFTKSVLVVPLQNEEPRGGDRSTDRKAPLIRTQKSPSFESRSKSKGRSHDPSEPIHIPKNHSFSFADLVGASQRLPYSCSSKVRRPVSANSSHLPHSLSAGSPPPQVSPRFSSLSPPPASPSTSSSSSSPPSPNESALAPQTSTSPPPSPSSSSPPPSPKGGAGPPFTSGTLPSSSSSSPFPPHAVSSSSSFLSVDPSTIPASPSPSVAGSHSSCPPTSSSSLPALPSVSPPPSRSSVLNPAARDTLPLSLPAATQSFMASHPNTASVSLFSVVKNESEVKFESKFVEVSPEKEKGPFDYEVWVGRSDAVLNILGVKQSQDSEFVVEGVGEVRIPDAVLCMCAVRGVEIWVGSPIAIFRILISTRKLIESIQSKDMRRDVACMVYVDGTGEVWTSDDAGAGIVSIRSSRSGRTKETLDLDDDKVTSMSVVGEQVLCGTFKGSIIVFDSRRYTVLQTLLRSHHSSVRCFAITPAAFWSGGRDKALCAWGVRWCEDDPTLYRVESPPEKEETNKNRKSWARRFFPGKVPKF